MVSAGLLALTPLLPARADQITGAITSVSIRESAAAENSAIRLDLSWAVPDSAGRGDAFTLTLPDTLRTFDGAAFALRAADGPIVADAKVDGQVVTFTLTDYVDDHVNVSGNAWFSLHFADRVQAGGGQVFEFVTAGKMFRDTVYVTGVTLEDYSSSATKWQTWKNPATNDPPRPAGDVILWAIAAPRVTEETAGGTITFVDQPGPGQAIDCTAIQASWSSKNTGALDNIGTIGQDRYTTSCTPNRLELTMRTDASDIGKVPYLLGWSSLTDPTLRQYVNTATVAVSTGGSYTVRRVLDASAGGDGRGERPTPTDTGTPTDGPTTQAPTPTDTSTTGTGTPTETASPTDTTTVTPTSPATTAATITTTATPTASTNSAAPTSPASPTTMSTATSIGTDSPTDTSPVTVTPTGSAAPTNGSTASPTHTPTSTRTLLPTSSASPTPAPVGGGHTPPTSGGSPRRIDTGLPGADAQPWLLGGGAALVAGAGAGLLVLGRRRDESTRR